MTLQDYFMDHVQLQKEWVFDRNTIKPEEISPNSHKRVWWQCKLGHFWQAMVFSRTKENPCGCPYCTGRKALPGFNDLATLKPKVAEEWHPSLNGDLKPEDVTLGSNKKVWWQCKEGHVWNAVIYSRTKKQGGTRCPVCAGTVKQPRPNTNQNTKKIQARAAKKTRSAAVNI